MMMNIATKICLMASLLVVLSPTWNTVGSVLAVAPLAWAYINGHPSVGTYGSTPSFGTLGVESTSNTPGSTSGCGALDSDGNYWTYGGYFSVSGSSQGDYGTLMRYNVTSNQWSLMSGSTATNIRPVLPSSSGIPPYGIEGASYYPGARSFFCNLIIDPSTNNVFLFGGHGYGSSGNAGYLSDLWRWRPSTGQWTFLAGSPSVNVEYDSTFTPPSRGVYQLDYYPSGRTESARARYGSILYIYGGSSLSDDRWMPTNDLWAFDMSTPTAGWAWLSGSDHTTWGPIGVPTDSCTPEFRYGAGIDFDTTGVMWMFGGYTPSGYSNEVFSFNIATNQWTWIGGSMDRGKAAGWSYGTLGVASATNWPGARTEHGWASDRSGMFWMVGGRGWNNINADQLLNDVWRYNPTSNQWTWFGGYNSGGGVDGSYGTFGVPATTNVLGSRMFSTNVVIDNYNTMLVRGVSGTVSSSMITFSGVDEIWRPNQVLRCGKGQTKPSPIEDACSDCPAGRFGSMIGEARALCAGACAIGYYCPAASTSSTQYACPTNTTSLAGATSASDCYTPVSSSSSSSGVESSSSSTGDDSSAASPSSVTGVAAFNAIMGAICGGLIITNAALTM